MEERTITCKKVYEGRIVSLELHDVELSDGRLAKREVVRHGPAVAVVAEGADGRFAFVRQYRKPVERAMLEVVAGNVEPGEDLTAAALRELREETGHVGEHIRRLGAIYPSPGYVDERIEIYAAQLSGNPVGLDLDADEHVELVWLTREEIFELMETDQLQDAKTLAAWQLYEREMAKGGVR